MPGVPCAAVLGCKVVCNAPLVGWRSLRAGETGKRRVVFDRNSGFADLPVTVPCGKCTGCLLARSREWAARCVNEASLWAENVFVTLTYREDSLPRSPVSGLPSLRPKDFVLFMKLLRTRRFRGSSLRRGEVWLGPRFFQAGEYGALGRPHHHAILFNCGFTPSAVVRRTASSVLYRSAELEELWPHGFSSFGEVTFESAAYVARYTVKKFAAVVAGASGSGGQAPAGVDQRIAEPPELRVPEYLTMSRRPGIGAGWLAKYESDVFPEDELRVGRYVMRPPRYYQEQVRKRRPAMVARVEAVRRAKRDPSRGSEQRVARGRIQEAKLKLRKGGLA